MPAQLHRVHRAAPADAAGWEAARRRLDLLPGGRGLNIAYEAVDRHVAHGRGSSVALRCLDSSGGVRDLTYADLARLTNRFANVLSRLGVDAGERVFLLLDRVAELYVAALGGLKARAVVCPLFSAFGPEPVAQRMRIGDARVLVTTPRQYARKVAGQRDRLPTLEHVLLAGEGGGTGGEVGPPGTHGFGALLDAAGDAYEIQPTDPEDPALLHFTSGTTGAPKGAVHVHEAVVAHHATGAQVLGLRPGDVYWCTADPGWVTGTSYGMVSPLTNGVTAIVDQREFDVDRWYRILAEQRVAVWYTAPTALRMLMRAGAGRARAYDLSALRWVASVGEPLNPEAVRFGEQAIGQPVRDTWWQTETGSIMIANVPGMPVRPGSMGRPLPGVEAGLLAQGPDGRAAVAPDGSVQVVDEPDMVGELALRAGWPSMFRGYLHEEERYRRCFAAGWYLSGDLARRDPDGYYWFVGRADDVIKSAGHLIGPFEVESVLMEHPAVVEAGVYGAPDPVAGEVVHARVSLRPGQAWSDALRRELIGFARRRLGAAVAPRAVEVDQNLPKTKSGKIMRRVLRARELGLPEGDLSTLEVPS